MTSATPLEPEDGLKRAASRGASLTLASQWVRFALQLGSTAVLGRLLTPGDYGLIAMVLVITGLADRFKDLGLSAAAIQRPELTDGQSNSLFWINLGLGAVLTAAVAAGSGLIAAFYGRTELRAIALALSINFFIGASAAQHDALLKRNLRFRSVATAEILSLAVGVAAAITTAVFLRSYWALVVLYIVTEATRSAILWRASDFRPSRPGGFREARSLVSFGGKLTGFELTNYAARNADNFIIGKVQGPGELGLYSRAYQLLLLPLQRINHPIGAVAIPTLSRLQGDPERYRRYYITALNLIAYVTVPIVGLMAILAEEVVVLALGDQWLEAAELFRILAIAGITQVVSVSNGWLYITTGRTGRMALWGLASRSAIVIAFVIGIAWGTKGIAVSYAIVSWLLIVPAFALATRGSPVSLPDIGRAIARPIVVSTGMFVAAWLTRVALIDAPLVLRVLATGTAALVVALATVAVWPAARRELEVLRGVVSDIFGKRRDAST